MKLKYPKMWFDGFMPMPDDSVPGGGFVGFIRYTWEDKLYSIPLTFLKRDLTHNSKDQFKRLLATLFENGFNAARDVLDEALHRGFYADRS